MAITITHPVITTLYVTFDEEFTKTFHGTLDEITEEVCITLHKKNFHIASGKDIRNKELLRVERS